jgi:outer membrane protein TolC
VRNLQDAALQDYLATDQARHAVQLMLLTDVANGYYRLRELDERITLADRMIASHEETLRIFRRRVEVGSTSRFDLMQVQTLLNQAQSPSAQLQQTRAAQSHALTLLVGTPSISTRREICLMEPRPRARSSLACPPSCCSTVQTLSPQNTGCRLRRPTSARPARRSSRASRSPAASAPRVRS